MRITRGGLLKSSDASAAYEPIGAEVRAVVVSEPRRRRPLSDFGVIGDGVVDDSAAMQAAVDSTDPLQVGENTVKFGSLTDRRVSSGAGASDVGETPIDIEGVGHHRSRLMVGATSGYGLELGGTATNLTLQGIVAHSRLADLSIEGPGRSGNTTTGLRVVAYDHFDMERVQVVGFGSNGIFLDREYYGTGSPVRDDRGSFAKLESCRIRNIGGNGIQAGGTFETDHLNTVSCEIDGIDGWGANVWAQTWDDMGSLFAGVLGGVKVRSDNVNYSTEGVNFIGTRFEQAATVACLQIGLCTTITAIGCNFIARNQGASAWAVIVGANSGDNVTQATFLNCFFNSDGTGAGCYRVAPNGGASVILTHIGPLPSTGAGVFPVPLSNPNSQLCTAFAGNYFDTGPTSAWATGPRSQAATGLATYRGFRRGESNARVEIMGADGTLRMGPGSSSYDSDIARAAAGTFAVRDSSGNERDRIGGPLSVTAANLGAIGNAINTTAKFAGKRVWDSTNNKPLWAKGSAAADVWIDGSNTTVITPA